MEITIDTPLGTKVYHKDTKIEYKIEKIHNNLGFLKILLSGYWVYANEYLIVEEPKEEIKYSDFSNAKVGDVVYNISLGKGIIEEILPNNAKYRIMVKFGKLLRSFDIKGMYGDNDNYSSLFWQPIPIPNEAYKKPLPKLEVDTLVLVWGDDSNRKRVRFFKSFTDDGKIIVFDCGYNSQATILTSIWDNWELYK